MHEGIPTLCGRKSWKLSLRVFFDLFYLVCTSQDDAHDQGLINFHPKNGWFKCFGNDYGALLTSETPYSNGSPCFLLFYILLFMHKLFLEVLGTI